jgi:hypothetical protein
MASVSGGDLSASRAARLGREVPHDGDAVATRVETRWLLLRRKAGMSDHAAETLPMDEQRHSRRRTAGFRVQARLSHKVEGVGKICNDGGGSDAVPSAGR